MYVGGMSSSLPEDVQDAMYHSVPGTGKCPIVKNAYAIEYDCINPRQLYPTLEFKNIKETCSARGSLTEAPDMRKRQRRD